MTIRRLAAPSSGMRSQTDVGARLAPINSAMCPHHPSTRMVADMDGHRAYLYCPRTGCHAWCYVAVRRHPAAEQAS